MVPSKAAFARIAPFAAFILFIALAPLVRGLVDDRWWVVARGLVAGALLLAFWRHYVELKKGSGAFFPPRPGVADSAPKNAPDPFFEYVLAVVVGLVVFVAWITFDFGWLKVGGGGAFVPLRADGSVDPVLVALRLVGLAAVVPILEELFWRSFLMRWITQRDFLALEPRHASLAAFALSSALFASEHAQWFAGLIAGFAYGWLYRRSGNLWIPIVSHASTNGTLGIWILATGQWSYW